MKLKTTLSKLRHDGYITDAEYSIIINALNRKPKERVIAEIKVDEDTLRKLVKDKVDELTTKFATQPCEDYIKRADVLALAEKGVLVSNDNYQAVCKAINELPPVMPKGETITDFADRCRECGKMRKGHWIYDKTFENWRCSKCNESPKTLGYVGTADFMAEHFKFCNHCGAKMVEPQESESDD